MQRTDTVGAATGVTLAVMGLAAILALAVRQDRAERALIQSGACQKLTEVLYTPPPVTRTSCRTTSTGNRTNCTTMHTPSVPYMRTLWRCKDPERGGHPRDIWRRSAEEY